MYDDAVAGRRTPASAVGTHPLRVALVAHDALKDDLTAWAVDHRSLLSRCEIVATGTTGGRVAEACPELDVTRLKSGPFGGDQQIGALIAEGELGALIFFVDGLSNLPHDADVKALMRLALVYDIPCAFNQRTASLLLKSGFIEERSARIHVEEPARTGLSLVA